MGQINLYTAVEEMKAVSKAEGTFSIKFRKYNRQKQSGGDLVFLKAARLRSKASDEKIENASHKTVSCRYGNRQRIELLADSGSGI